jgi:hypothetical protein
MSRRKGDKNKKQVPARERYWRAEYGVDRVTNDVLRTRKARAKKEQDVANAAYVAWAKTIIGAPMFQGCRIC